EYADAKDIGLQRLDARQQRRKIRRAEWVADGAKVLRVDGLTDFKKTAEHLVTIGIVGGEERNPVAEIRKRIAADGTRRHVWIQRLVESIFAEVRGLVDGI